MLTRKVKTFHDLKLSFAMITLILIKLIINQPESLREMAPLTFNYSETEAKLAIGVKLNASYLSQADLERIPQVSSAIAQEILKNRPKLAPQGPKNNLEKLQSIKGIGKVKAKTIENYLMLD